MWLIIPGLFILFFLHFSLRSRVNKLQDDFAGLKADLKKSGVKIDTPPAQEPLPEHVQELLHTESAGETSHGQAYAQSACTKASTTTEEDVEAILQIETKQEPAPPVAPEPVLQAAPQGPLPPSRFDEAVQGVSGFIKDFFTSGNLVLKIGLLLVFVGSIFLVKYSVEQGWFPVELRLLIICALGLALTVVGFRVRETRQNITYLLQGGGIAIFYLTIFAAFKFYQVLPSWLALLILLATVTGASFLAIIQRSLAMAVLSVLGGFLAPIITSTGSNNFTALFSYYIVLNLGIFLMAWFRAWRILNYLAFKFTFGVAVVWLLTRYEPVFLLSSEMFFTAFFVLFFIISIVYAVKQPVKLKGLVDGSLVFGLPIVYFYMQSVLLKPYEYGLAYLAAIMVVVYFGTAFVLRKMFQDRMEALIQSYYAIGVVFITLVGPLALSAQWTSAYWALQGAGLVWIGVRQARTLARFSGLALIVVAGFSFTSLFEGKPVSLDYVIPVLNADFLSSVIKALTALYAGLYLRRQTNDKLFHAEAEKGIAAFVVLYGLCWWYLGLGREIMLHAPLGSQNLLALVLVIGSYLVLKPLARVTQDSFLKQFNLITAAVAAPIILERYWISLAWSCLSVDLVCQLKVMYGDAAKKDSDLVFRHVILLLLMVLFNGILFFHWQSHPALISLGNLSVCVFAVSAFFVAWVLYSETSKMRGDLISHVMILFVFGVFWFVGINYIDQAVSYVFAGKDQVIMIFMLSTLVLSQALHARLYWKAATFPIQVAILPLTAVVFVWDWTNAHPAGDLGWVTHILLIGLMAWSCWLWQHHAKKPLEEDLITAPFTKVVHWFGVLFMISAVTLEAQWLAKGLVPAHPVWYDLVFCLIPAGFLVLLMKLKDKPVWPVMENVIVYHLAVPAALVAYLLGTTWYFNASPGDSGGLAYIPILNPIDLCMIGVFLSLFAWRFFLERQKLLSDKTHLHALGLVIWVFMFFWLNATLLRSVHHWAGVAYTFDDLYASRIAQSAVSIYWALIAMVTMVYSSKKLLRHVWLGGAVLLGLIVCKLVFVDLANRGTFERIVSFIGVGIVFLLIGFFSPLPKKLKE